MTKIRRICETALWLVVLCVSPLQAAQTSSIVLSPDEKTVCAVNQDADSICLWNWSGDGLTRVVAVGQEPRTLAFAPDGRTLYVANQSSQTLSVVDVEQAKAVHEIPLGAQPYGVLISPDGQRAFVSQYAGGYLDGKYCEGIVAVVDLRSREPVARIPVKARPWAMALNAEGTSLYVTHYLNIGGRGLVTEIAPQRQSVTREIFLREDDHVRDGQGGVFNALAAIALHPNGKRALVAGMHGNVLRGTTLNGQPLSHKTTVQAAVRVIDLTAGQEMYESKINSSFSGQAVAVPSAVSFIGASDHYLDVYFASSDFKVIQYNEQGVVAERALRSLPAGPSGVAITRDGRTAFFCNRWDRSLSQFSLTDLRNPTLVKNVRACAEPWDAERLQGAVLFHNTRDTRMTANRWMSCGVCHLEGGVVSDGLVWDLTVPGAKPKLGNTMDLINMSIASPPFFHRGTITPVESLERFVQIFQQGFGFLRGSSADFATSPIGDWESGAPNMAAFSPGGMIPTQSAPATDTSVQTRLERTSPEWNAMFSYMNALRARPNPHMDGNRPRPEIRAAAERGRKLFFDRSTGCSHCHSGPAMTVAGPGEQLSVFDVGTGTEVKTPSLLDLWDTAPYLHDGRAITLIDVLTTHNRKDRHGKTSQLSAEQLDDLIAFLLTPYDSEKP